MLLLLPFALGMDCKEGVTLPAPVSLATVDWCNFDYKTGWGPLIAGRQEIHEWGRDGGPHDTILHILLGVQPVELLPDAGQEMLVLLRSEKYIHRFNTALRETQLHLYAWREGKPVLVWSGFGPLAYEVKFQGTRVELLDHGRCVEKVRAEASGLLKEGC